MSTKSKLIKDLLIQGLSYDDIQKKVSVSKPTISFHAKKLGIAPGVSLFKKKDICWEKIQTDIDLGMSVINVTTKHSISKSRFYSAVHAGEIKYNFVDKLTTDQLFVENGTYGSRGFLRNIILKENLLLYLCSECNQGPMHNNKPLSLHLDHINGVNTDHRLVNLRFLCPNCHTQTPTYGSKNRKKVTEHLQF